MSSGHVRAIHDEYPQISAPMAVITLTFLIFTTLLGLSIAIYALWRIFYKHEEELRTVDKTTIYTAASCIILHAFPLILDPFAYFFAVTHHKHAHTSDIMWTIWVVFWTLSKLNLYFVYIYRCYITFKDTKYAYSIKVYIPLIIAWILQLLNGVIFVVHRLYDANILKDKDKPLSTDDALLIADIIYLILDVIMVLTVVYLFLNPVTNLMVDLKRQTDRVKCDSVQNEVQQLVLAQTENYSSSSEATPTTPHSPTKLGAKGAYYYKPVKKRKHNKVTVATGHQHPNTSTEAKANSLQLPCPEDEEKDIKVVWSEKTRQLLNTGTRLALLTIIALSSGFLYQFMWILSLVHETMYNFTFTWAVDTVINVVCIYLSFQFAVQEYNILCSKCCHCHKCCLRYVECMAMKRL